MGAKFLLVGEQGVNGNFSPKKKGIRLCSSSRLSSDDIYIHVLSSGTCLTLFDLARFIFLRLELRAKSHPTLPRPLPRNHGSGSHTSGVRAVWHGCRALREQPASVERERGLLRRVQPFQGRAGPHVHDDDDEKDQRRYYHYYQVIY